MLKRAKCVVVGRVCWRGRVCRRGRGCYSWPGVFEGAECVGEGRVEGAACVEGRRVPLRGGGNRSVCCRGCVVTEETEETKINEMKGRQNEVEDEE